MQFVESIRNVIQRHQLLPDGTDVVAAVSGGADSVALLRALHQLDIRCTVAHLHHGLRGAEADADERFVRELATELGLPLTVKHVSVQALADHSGQSLEMAARQARHVFFSEFSDAVIALAHHADDQVETFILKLARGAGPAGLCGMSYRQQVGSIRLVRPMLDLPRRTIVDWLEQNGFPWRDDASNSDERFVRNRVRHTILPMLEKELNPNFRETILRTMNVLREEDEWMDSLIADDPLPAAGLPLALRRRVLRKWLFEQGADAAGFDAVDHIIDLMDAGQGTRTFELSEHQRVVVEYGMPRFEKASLPVATPEWTLTVEKGTGWRRDHGNGAGILPAEASFDADKIGSAEIEVRAWRPGDRMKPHGMTGSRKLQDIFTDQKIPVARRSCIPVVTCRDEIIWLPGYRTASGWEVPEETGNAVHIRVD